MTGEQIRYWARQGIEFGAHSRTHAHLTKLSAAELAAEVIGSKDDLSRLLGYPPTSFAYPYGEYNGAVCDLVRSAFDLAFSAEDGLVYLSSDPHLLRRTYVGHHDSILEFALCVRRGEVKTIRHLGTTLAVRTRLKRVFRIGSSHL